jgi:exodeoxyribonuclease V beta subunit
MSDLRMPSIDSEAVSAPVQPFDLIASPLGGLRVVEASAGTGKTWTLCGLVLRLLIERELDIAEILVVTFTKAATAELRDRIRARLVDALAHLRQDLAVRDAFLDRLLAAMRERSGLADEALAVRLDQAVQRFDEASIFTIHGFCQRALDELPFTAGAPLALELMPDDRPLRLQVAQDHWRRRVAGADLHPALAEDLLEHGLSPDRLADALGLRIAKPLATLRWPDGLDARPDLDLGPLEAAFAAARRLWRADRDGILAALRGPPKRLKGNQYTPDVIERAAGQWTDWFDLDDPRAAMPAKPVLDRFTPERLARGTLSGKETPMHPFFDAAAAVLQARAEVDDRLMRQRLRLVRDLLDDGPAALAALKAERRIVSYSDLLGNLHQRLTDGRHPGLAQAVQARWPAALIDEFQDTDPLQWQIFETIYPPAQARDGDPRAMAPPVFLVGDPKQAIYRFRNADLHTYLRARAEALAVSTLAANQRSVPPLLVALNALFGRHAAPFAAPGIGYVPVSAGLKPRPPLHDATEPRAPLGLWALPGLLDADAAEDRLLLQADAQALAIETCAAEVARLVAAGQRGEIRIGERPLAAGDIAVLVRTHAHAAAVRAALSALDVGSVALSQASVFSSPDAEELSRVLAAVLEPSRDGRVRAALSTEALGWTADRIAALDGDEAALLDQIERLQQMRDSWQRRGIGLMLREWMAREGVTARLLARPDGERRLTNWRHLIELLHGAAREHTAPEALQRWLIGQIRDPQPGDEATQLRLESDQHLVQVVTIHRCKGLEFPMVFCPMLWESVGHKRVRGEPTQWQDGDRAVIDWRERLSTEETAQRDACIETEHLAESLRLVYVAMTRAVYRCTVVVGTVRRKTGAYFSTKLSRRSPMNWLVAGGGSEPADWCMKPPNWETLQGRWQAFAALAGQDGDSGGLKGTLDLIALPELEARRVVRAAVDRHAICALPPPVLIPPRWTIGSYSGLAHGARAEIAAIDHDAWASVAAQAMSVPAMSAQGPWPASRPQPAPVADDSALPALLAFPRGPVAGECLHAVFEAIDFADASTWTDAIDRALTRFAIAADQAPTLHQMLHDTLCVPLLGAPALRLAGIGRAARLVELEFSLPVGRLTAASLTTVLRRHGLAVPALGFAPLEGYLRGFIDAVVEHDGRFHVIDWKSNHLGHRPDDYTGPRLEAAMQQHAYHLQALVYSVALRRLLRHRGLDRTDGADRDASLGEVLYLFVRGIRPGWVSVDGRPAGVHAWRPTSELLDAFEALIDPAPATGAVASGASS